VQHSSDPDPLGAEDLAPADLDAVGGGLLLPPPPPDAAAPPIFVGRAPQLDWCAQALAGGASLLVRGPAGIGKRALLAQVHARLTADGTRVCLWPPGTSRPKEFTFALCEQVHRAVGLQVPESLIPPRFRSAARRTGAVPFAHIRRGVARMTTADQFELALASLASPRGQGAGRGAVVVFLDTLDLPPTLAEMVERLLDTAQLAATLEGEPRRGRTRILRLLWRFERQLELKPLARTEVREWVEAWLARHPLHFERPRLRAAFITAVCRDAGGVPAAVEGMLAAALTAPEVSRETMRDLSHEAAVRYLDMTPLIIIAAAGFMALRYISRGMGMQELMVMAGVGTSLFWVVLYFARMMQARR
jgi:hypothetical protein